MIKKAQPKFEKGQYVRYWNAHGVKLKFVTWEIVSLDYAMYRYKLQRTDENGKKHSRWLAFVDQYGYRRDYAMEKKMFDVPR